MLINRNISVGDLRTSIRLEPEFWDGLSEIALREGRKVDDICTAVDRDCESMTRTAAIRVFIAKYFQTRIKPGNGVDSLQSPE